MNSLQESSIRIKKKTRNTKSGERSYICGGCQRAYKSYPALYLHIKRKHGGVRPPNTKASKPVGPVSSEKTHTGRPQKVFFVIKVVLLIFLGSHHMMLMTFHSEMFIWKIYKVSYWDF